jgi:hypothetical protein
MGHWQIDIERGNKVLGQKLFQSHFFHQNIELGMA